MEIDLKVNPGERCMVYNPRRKKDCWERGLLCYVDVRIRPRSFGIAHIVLYTVILERLIIKGHPSKIRQIKIKTGEIGIKPIE